MTDPYRELGIPRGASKKDIKRAYQRKAHETHPDREGGDGVAFARANAAYRLLSDDSRRAQFDATGNAEAEQDERAQAIGAAATILLHMIDSAPASLNIISEARRQLCQQIQVNREQRKQREAVIARRTAALKRLKRKAGGENLLAIMIENEISKVKGAITNDEREVDSIKNVIAIIDEYEYSDDLSALIGTGFATYLAFGPGQQR